MLKAPSAALVATFLLVSGCSTTPKIEDSPDPRWKARMRTEMSTGRKGDPEERDRWYWEQRAYPTGSIPIAVHRAAVQRELLDGGRMRAEAGDRWENIGPAPLLDITYGLTTAQNSSGRALSLAIHPNNPNILFLGTAQGGIWKSSDRGATWQSVAEQSLPTLAINIIRYRPGNPNVMYAATGEPNGSTSIHGTGLLRSNDGGETWETLPSRGNGWSFEYAAVTGLEFDSRDARTMYVSTATVVTASKFFQAREQPQTGVFKSTDGGESWTMVYAARRHTLADGSQSASAGVRDLEYGGPNAPDLLYASEWLGGILKSIDAGATWASVTPRKASGVGDLPAPVPSMSYFDGKTRRFVTLNRIPLEPADPEVRRIELGVSPANPNVVYAGYDLPVNRLDYDSNGRYEANRDRAVARGLLFKSEDAGATWRWLGTLKDGIPEYCGAQCSYDNVVSVNPENENDVLLGGMANYSYLQPDPLTDPKRLLQLPWRGMVYRSLDGGRSWVDTTPHCTRIGETPIGKDGDLPVYRCADMDTAKVIHPDIHDIVYGPNGSIYVMNDGGIYRTTTPGVSAAPKTVGRRRSVAAPSSAPFAGLAYTWENLNDRLSTLQFYRVASHPTDPNIIIGAMQDNSSGYWNGSTWQGWGAGDGTIAIFDPLDPKYVYLGTPGEVHRHDAGGEKDFGEDSGWTWGVFSGLDVAEGETTPFLTVFALDPVSPNITYGASNRGIYRSTARGQDSVRLAPGMNTTGAPSWISVSRMNHNVVWAGTGTGSVYRYDIAANGTATMKRVGINSLPNRHVSAVAAGYDSADTVYAVFNGYDVNTPSTPGKVFLSTDGGTTWRNISGNLPDVPATRIALHPTDVNRLWLATDTAIYTTSDRGATWTSERHNMPVVAVQDLHYNANTGYLVAATHGRGVWRMKVGSGTASAD